MVTEPEGFQSLRSEFKPLSPSEEKEKQRLEGLVIGAVWTAGVALQELRDKRLYRDTHSSFKEYCQDKFGHSRQKSDYLIVGAKIYENLAKNRCQILPTTEYQVRPLGVLEAPEQVQAWSEAVELAQSKVPTSRLVKQAVRQLTQQRRENPFELEEVVGIVAKDNPQLKGKNGCWAIVSGISKVTCDLQTWSGQLAGIEIEYLKEMEYTWEECQVIHELHKRLERIQQTSELEGTAKGVLKLLGKIDRPYLTPLEEEMLKVLEKAYGS